MDLDRLVDVAIEELSKEHLDGAVDDEDAPLECIGKNLHRVHSLASQFIKIYPSIIGSKKLWKRFSKEFGFSCLCKEKIDNAKDLESFIDSDQFQSLIDARSAEIPISHFLFYKSLLEFVEDHRLSVVELLRTVHFYPQESDYNHLDYLLKPKKVRDTKCLEIDCICDNGCTWVKFRTKTENFDNFEIIDSFPVKKKSKSILDLARELLTAASQNPFYYRPPRILIVFTNTISLKVFSELRNMGVDIQGRVSGPNHVTSFLYPHPFESKVICCVNLDVTAMIAICSEITNNSHLARSITFTNSYLNMQAVDEETNPALEAIHHFLLGKEVFVTTTALSRFNSIIESIAGKNEKQRAVNLLKKVKIINSNPSPRSIHLGKKMCKRSKRKPIVYEDSYDNEFELDENYLIFGTADRLQMITLTSNSLFLKSCSNQGLDFVFHLHSPRALCESKMPN